MICGSLEESHGEEPCGGARCATSAHPELINSPGAVLGESGVFGEGAGKAFVLACATHL